LEFHLKTDFPPHHRPILHSDKILLIGSCFTEHISKRLSDAKMNILSNPHGILFNPLSVCSSIDAYIDNRIYEESDLFFLNEIHNCWGFHTRFSHTQPTTALQQMNESVGRAAHFLKDAQWLIITLGSAFQYFLKNENGDLPVANCHRAPGQWFEKRLLPIDTIINQVQHTLHRLHSINPTLNIIFTISPVRHIRDGVVDNNRSKARLLEAVHTIVEQNESCSYFPAYELVIDILRDYRFYDIDMVHPNYSATQFVWEHFAKTYFTAESQDLLKQLMELTIARHHHPRFPDTEAHRRFLANQLAKVQQLKTLYPYIDFDEDMAYFQQ
jgi:hypothetical protein